MNETINSAEHGMKEGESSSERKYSIGTYASFAVMMFGFNAMIFVVGQQYPIFYQTIIGLDIGMMFLASIIYTIWDMFNDPIVGHLSDKNYGFTQRWGKRLPWIVGCTVPLLLSLVLLFTPPGIDLLDGIFTFFWFLIFLSIYDGLLSAITVNYNALLPVKFRSKKERAILGSFIQLFLMLGPFIGLAVVSRLAPEPSSYMSMSVFLAVFAFISFLLSLPGLKEDESIKETYIKEEIKEGSFFQAFSSNIKQAFQLKPFIVLAVVTLCMTVSLALISVSQPYYVMYILGLQDKTSTEYGQAIASIAFPFVLTSILFIPIYFWIVRKVGHSKAFKWGLLISPIPLLLIFFSYILGAQGSVPLIMLGAAGWGVVAGIIVISRYPVQGDFFDSSALDFHRRQEGMYLGIWNFFARLVTVIQFGVLWFIQTITSFDPNATTQNDLANWGIMVHFGLVPAVLMLIATLVFWKFWDLSPSKMETIKTDLEELGI
ncbi:MAG: MFS transporter [Candidatus Hodarchaeales archaeon]|jgi:GPH family glycoside/pentoside/hexuronide:cation symporter